MRSLSIIILLVFFSCSGSEESNQINISPQEMQEQLLEANKRALSVEKKTNSRVY